MGNTPYPAGARPELDLRQNREELLGVTGGLWSKKRRGVEDGQG